MSDWKAYRELNAEASPEQHEKLQRVFFWMMSESMIAIPNGSEETGPIVVSEGRAEREHRVPVYTPGMIKFSWEDEWGVQWQGWMAADGEVVQTFHYLESDLEDGPEGGWFAQSGRTSRMNRVGA